MGHCCFIGSCEQCETQRRVVLEHTRGYGGFFTCNPGERPVLHYTRRERVGLVLEGATTPWSWASKPGLSHWEYSGEYFSCEAPIARPRFYIASVRLPEPLSPEAVALVQAARGGK